MVSLRPMTIQEAVRWIGSVCGELYDDREAAAITNLVMEKLTGLDRSARAIRRTEVLEQEAESELKKYAGELSTSRPVQYVLGETWFAGLRFSVDERVLIPRPETEELVKWILDDATDGKMDGKVTLLDIGTGSGCIPCAVGKKRTQWQLRACDVSPAALQVAATNAGALNVPVDFFVADILDSGFGITAGRPDIVVSNPPYIPAAHRGQLDRHVSGFEPALALFVNGDDPLMFYKKIGLWVKTIPAPGPLVFLELHHDFAKQTAAWFSGQEFKTDLRKDYSGNNRMLRAWR